MSSDERDYSKTGSIKPHRGKFRVRGSFSGRKVDRLFSREDEAEVFLAACRKRAAIQGPARLSEVAAAYFKHCRSSGHRKIEYIKTEEGRWKTHVAGKWIDRQPIRSINRPDVYRWIGERATAISDRTGRPYSRSSVKHALTNMKLVFKFAANTGLVAHDITRGVDVPKMTKSNFRWTFLRPHEIRQLFAFEGLTDEQRAFFGIANFAGLRKSEIHMLAPGDVDLVERIIHVDGSKSDASQRRVPIMDALHEFLCRHMASLPDDALYLFPGRHPGKPRHSDNDMGWADKRYRVGGELRVTPGVKTRAGITRAVRFHDLRHTFCSAIVSGYWGEPMSLHEARDLAGHSDIKITQRYAHLSPEGVEAKFAKLSAYWRALEDTPALEVA